MPTERLYRGAVAKFEALFQVPSSVSLLFICYVLYTMSRKTWYDYTVALSIRLLLYLSHHMCVYMTIHGLPILGVVVLWCSGCAGWLVLCAVTLSPCTSVELISLSLQLMITCSMRQYNILQSAVSSLASSQRAQSPLEPPCALWYTEHPFMCATATFCYLSHSILTTPSVSMNYTLAR